MVPIECSLTSGFPLSYFFRRKAYLAKNDLDSYGENNPLFEQAAIEGQNTIYESNADYEMMSLETQ